MAGKESSIQQFPKSYWREFKAVPSFPVLQENSETGIGVIGGGIAGIVSAYLLTKAGKKVVLVEAGKLIDGVTGFTTAKITAQHGLIYEELIRTMGEERAKQYYEANLAGLHFIKKTAADLGIDCDLTAENAYVYAETKKGAQKIEKEAKAYERLGIDGGLAKEEINLPFAVEAALVMRNQAQFHPVKFLTGLIKEIERLGGKIYEQTRVLKVLDQDIPVIVTENMSLLSCDQVIIASHYPINDAEGMYFTKLSVNRSYAIAASTEMDVPAGMYISADLPTRSLRSILTESGEQLLLIGGEGHLTGRSKVKTSEHYQNLETFGRKYFGIQEIPYHWSAQDLTTLDKLPYIGKMTDKSDRILVATGFNKWGMSNGAVAGMVLADQIMGNTNIYANVFDPTRTKLKTVDAKIFVKDNVSVAKELIAGKIEKTSKKIDDLSIDEGGMVEVDGKKIGGYRDENGQLHLVNTTCTHLGCTTKWNDAERTWDCPCHGSRFSYEGEVLEGPAINPLKTIGDE